MFPAEPTKTPEERRQQGVADHLSGILSRDSHIPGRITPIKRKQLRGLELYLVKAVQEAEASYQRKLGKTLLDLADKIAGKE